jgi:hypothetical protein
MSDIKGKRPRVVGARVAGLRLTPEERFLMARIDGELSVSDLVRVTGLDEGRVEQLVSKLAIDGAVDLAPPARVAALPAEIVDGGTTSMADFAAALGMDPSQFAEQEEAPAPVSARPRPRIQLRRREPPTTIPDPAPAPDPTPAQELEPVMDLEAVADLVERMPAPPETNPDLPETTAALDAAALEAFGESPAELEEVLELEEVPELEEVAELEDVTEPETAPIDEKAAAKEDEVSRAVAERNYRQVYEKRWHELLVDQRIAGARSGKGTDLLALCFDPDPRVIAAILENATCGLDHVRLIAFYHRTGTGLEIVARRQDWLRDILVERRLLRNPMIGEIVLGRVMGPKRLVPTYKIAIDRDIPELTRAKSRGYIRQKWQTAPSEERADLVLRTEARCLLLMTGCTFDAKTTAILCGRPINSAMFVQSVAKFGASPPGLLAHLMKQPFVRKNAPLKKMLLAHPNMPGDVKRSV